MSLELSLPYFLARPSSDAPVPGVVVVQDSFGIGLWQIRLCQRLAAEGFIVAAPDLYFRVGGTESASWPELRASLDEAVVDSDLHTSASHLRELGATTVGILGFCLGGSLAYRMAVNSSEFGAAVGFYGVVQSFGSPRCPTQLIYGDKDVWISPEMVQAVVDHHPETVVYGAGHGFMRDGTDEYVDDAASDAWALTVGFLKQHLV